MSQLSSFYPSSPHPMAAHPPTTRNPSALLSRHGIADANDMVVELPQFGAGNRPFHFILAFHNLSYSISKSRPISCHRIAAFPANAEAADPERPSQGRKTLLDSISGEVRTGEILAVLGASGSGKSTLIDALANRIKRTSLDGSITLNGETLDGRLLKVIPAYVMQDDLLFTMLTVEETLMFASKKREHVQALIDQLGLRSAAETIIGDEGHRRVRRHVSIGADIIHDLIMEPLIPLVGIL